MIEKLPMTHLIKNQELRCTMKIHYDDEIDENNVKHSHFSVINHTNQSEKLNNNKYGLL